MRETSSGSRVGSNRRGFTLVELLVVIGIIALLISILLPALNKAREQANSVKCAANMRSAVQALQIYASESKGYLPGPHTSGALWTSGIDSIGPNESSSDETPTQNFDWVSPTYGKSFKWPENDYQRLRTIYNVQLSCPTNTLTNDSLALNSESLPYVPGDLDAASYSATIHFHVMLSREGTNSREPRIGFDMFDQALLQAPGGYAPQLNKLGPNASKVYLVEGARYMNMVERYTPTTRHTGVSFNAARYQRQGGNFMIGGPFLPWDDTPYQLSGTTAAYTSGKLTPIAKQAWRHAGKMNLAFFDGHVELRGPRESIQMDLYVPKGTLIKTGGAAETFDPNDRDGQIIN